MIPQEMPEETGVQARCSASATRPVKHNAMVQDAWRPLTSKTHLVAEHSSKVETVFEFQSHAMPCPAVDAAKVPAPLERWLRAYASEELMGPQTGGVNCGVKEQIGGPLRVVVAEATQAENSHGTTLSGQSLTGEAWWAWVELNYRPHPYQGCALAT